MSIWENLFSHLSQKVAQILLTRNDIADRTQYINAQNTITELLHMGVIPIVNENDTLSVAEIKFGDNDTLSAITAGMVYADYLFLMTDVDCLYDRNPRKFPDARPIDIVEDIDALQADVSSAGSSLGTGGMATKIVAARLATSAGVTTVITKSSKPGNISDIIRYLHPPQISQPVLESTSTTTSSASPQRNGHTHINSTSSIAITNHSRQPNPEQPPPSQIPPPQHTRFMPSQSPIRSRHFWLLHALAPRGTLYIDRGAVTALTAHRAGLLPVGVVDVAGNFAQQEAVRLVAVDRLSLGSLAGMTASYDVDDDDSTQDAGGSFGAANGENASSSTSQTPSASTSATSSSIAHHHSTPSRPLSSHHPFHLKGEEIGRAVVNYSSTEILRIKGLRSSEIASVLGYADSDYVCLRENVGLLGTDKHSGVTSRPESRADTPVQGGSRTPEKGIKTQ